jgi:hypothetical protein
LIHNHLNTRAMLQRKIFSWQLLLYSLWTRWVGIKESPVLLVSFCPDVLAIPLSRLDTSSANGHSEAHHKLENISQSAFFHGIDHADNLGYLDY